MNPLTALVILIVLATLAHRARVVGRSGVVAGLIIGMILGWTPTPAPFVAFLLFVLAGSISTRLGAARKMARGVAQKNEGRRGWTHALANAGPSALVLLAYIIVDGTAGPRAELAACAGLAAVLADTTASEWGQWLGGRPRCILTLESVPIGTDGAVTLTGLLASTAAAALAAACAWIWLGHASIMPMLAAGVGGNLMDSVLGASIEPRLGRAGNALVNAAAALTGIGLALTLST